MRGKIYTGLRRHLNQVRKLLTHRRRSATHHFMLPNLPAHYSNILKELRENGAAVTSLEQLMVPGTTQALAGLESNICAN